MKIHPELLADWASQGLRPPPLIHRAPNSLMLNIGPDNLALHHNIKWMIDDHIVITTTIKRRLKWWLHRSCAIPGQTIYLWGDRVSRWEGMFIPHLLAMYHVVHVNEQGQQYDLGEPIRLARVA